MTDPRAALADILYDVMYDCGDPHYAECTYRKLAERGVLLARNDPERLHQYLHDEGLLPHPSYSDVNEEEWHARVCEGALAALSGEVTEGRRER